MQELKLANGLSLKFPEEVVLIKKSELDKLTDDSLTARMWTIKDITDRLHVKRQWVLDNILANPRYENEINRMKVAGIIQKGDGRTSPWRFKAREFGEWLDRHETAFDFTKRR